jgi:uncharacterized protein (DUF697 family)
MADTNGELSISSRDAMAASVVSNYTAWSAVAGIIPVPVADVVAIAGLQLQMLRRLAQVYGVPFSQNWGKSAIAAVVGSVLPVSVASPVAHGVGSLLKGFPVVGGVVMSVTQPALAATTTYLIGKIFLQHFAAGGTLLSFNPEDYREYAKAQAAKGQPQAAAA